jgi:hypothetical protein
MKKRSLFVIVFLSVITMSSCLKTETFPDEPIIQFKSFTIKNANEARLVFTFTDGDGDVGLDQQDTIPPFDPESEFYHNLKMRLKGRVNGVWTDADWMLNYRVPYIKPTGQNTTQKGEMEVVISDFYRPDFQADTLRWEFFLIDRSLNISNTERTSVFNRP